SDGGRDVVVVLDRPAVREVQVGVAAAEGDLPDGDVAAGRLPDPGAEVGVVRRRAGRGDARAGGGDGVAGAPGGDVPEHAAVVGDGERGGAGDPRGGERSGWRDGGR